MLLYIILVNYIFAFQKAYRIEFFWHFTDFVCLFTSLNGNKIMSFLFRNDDVFTDSDYYSLF